MPTPARVVVVPQEMGARLLVEELKLPDPGPYQVVVKQFASGVCHSQLHQIHRPRTGPVSSVTNQQAWSLPGAAPSGTSKKGTK